MLVVSLGFLGVSAQTAFLFVSSLDLGLSGIFFFLLLKNSTIQNKFIVLFLGCFTFTSVNLIPNPIYTDNLFLGLLLACIYLQKKGYLGASLIVSSLAVLNRETSLIIWAYLVLVLVFSKSQQNTFRKNQIALVIFAPIAFIAPRIIISVPNKSYPIQELVLNFFQLHNLIAFLLLIFILLISTPILVSISMRNNKITTEDSLLFGCGIISLLICCSLGGNWERFLLTFWPMFLLFDSLGSNLRRNSLIAVSALGLFFLGFNDFVKFNSNINIGIIQIVEISILIGINLWIWLFRQELKFKKPLNSIER